VGVIARTSGGKLEGTEARGSKEETCRRNRILLETMSEGPRETSPESRGAAGVVHVKKFRGTIAIRWMYGSERDAMREDGDVEIKRKSADAGTSWIKGRALKGGRRHVESRSD
jgi:hypothetical protein